jgi:hypothetical protein
MRTTLLAFALCCTACAPAAPLVAAQEPPAPAGPTAWTEPVVPAGTLFDGEPLNMHFWPGQRWTYKAETPEGSGRLTLAIKQLDESEATFVMTRRFGDAPSATVERTFAVGAPDGFTLVVPAQDGEIGTMTAVPERVNVLAGSFDTIKLTYVQKRRNGDGEVLSETLVEQWGSKAMGLVRYSSTTRVPGAADAEAKRYVVELESFRLRF